MNRISKIKIIVKNRNFNASFYNNTVGNAIYDMLPIYSRINTWGDELYFSISLDLKLDYPVQVVKSGDIAYSEYWKCFCIFYGNTPLSNKYEIIPNGPVEIIGSLDEHSSIMKNLLSGYFREKKRRLANRFSILKRFAETITIKK